MANQQRGLLRIATQLDAGGGAGRIASFQGNVPDPGVDEALNKVAAQFSNIADDVGRWADKAAAAEGARAGQQAGLDPEFRPTRMPTIRGQAYDRAGLQVFETTMKIEIEGELGKIADEAKGDPARYAAAVAKRKSVWIDKVPQEMRPDIEHIYRRNELTFMRNAAREQAARTAQEQTAALQTHLSESLKGLHQRAFALGLDPESDAVLAGDIGQIQKLLARKGVDGKPLVNPVAAAKMIEDAKQEVATARLLGAFDRLPDVASKQSFLANLEDDFKSSSGLARHYDLPGFRRLQATLDAELRRSVAADGQLARALSGEIEDARKMAEKGFAPTQDQLGALKSRVLVAAQTTPEVADRFAQLDALVQWQAAARRATPAELDTYALEEARRVKAAPTPEGVQRVEMARKLATEMRAQLKTDPLGWADRVGLMKVMPLELSDATAAKSSIGARIAQAEEVAKAYGIEAKYLRPDEAQQLATLQAQGGPQAIQVAATLANAAGDRAPKLMREVFDKAPAMALLGGHVATVGPTAVAQDAANGIALSRTDGFKAIAPDVKRGRSLLQDVAAGALNSTPQTEQALAQLVNSAYEVRARRKGVSGTFDEALWKDTARELMGERKIDGERYGGVAWGNPGVLWGGSNAVMIPPDVKQGGFRDLVNAITLDDLADKPHAVNGQPLGIEAVRRARLVSVGPGRYRAALGDVEGGDPQWIVGAGGRAWELDLNALSGKLRERRPDLYLGGAGRKEPFPGMMRLGGPERPNEQPPVVELDSGEHDDFGTGKPATLKSFDFSREGQFKISKNYNRTLVDVTGPNGEKWTVDAFVNAWENTDGYDTPQDFAAAIRSGKVAHPDAGKQAPASGEAPQGVGVVSGALQRLQGIEGVADALTEVNRYEQGVGSLVSKEDYDRLRALMGKIVESDGMDRDAGDEIFDILSKYNKPRTGVQPFQLRGRGDN